jgi:thiamine-monophosphate kinase
MLVEGIHFLRSAKPEAIGWKTLAVNVSDIAAMGGVPRYAVISLGLPRSTRVSFVDGLYRGLTRCARKFGLSIVGGDTDRSEKIVIDVAILGEVEPSKVVYRCGAKAGDILFVTGRLGGAVRSGKHLTFTPRLREARALVGTVRPHAMIDLSDGLGPDLIRICEASGVSAQLDTGRIPRRAGVSLERALTEGEDFELLLAVSARDAKSLEMWASRHLSCGLTRVGKVIAHRKGPLVSILAPAGVKVPSSLAGFQHF